MSAKGYAARWDDRQDCIVDQFGDRFPGVAGSDTANGSASDIESALAGEPLPDLANQVITPFQPVKLMQAEEARAGAGAGDVAGAGDADKVEDMPSPIIWFGDIEHREHHS